MKIILRVFLSVLGVLSPAIFAESDSTVEPFLVNLRQPHAVMVLDEAGAALQMRLDMIERAQHDISVEYFQMNLDKVGRLFAQALVKKKIAHPEVRIRLLVDSGWGNFSLKANYASELASYGIEVKYYNQFSGNVVAEMYRDHRKLLLVDANEALTGGRNIGDEYFDLHPVFNFVDRDIWVQGPIVKYIGDSFEAYWNDRRSVTPRSVRRSRGDPAVLFVTETSQDRQLLSEVERVGRPQLEMQKTSSACNELVYVTDAPGFIMGKNRKNPKRHVANFIFEKLKGIAESAHPEAAKLIMETPYYIIRDPEAVATMNELAQKKVNTVLLTNGLASIDIAAITVSGHFIPRAMLGLTSNVNEKIFLFGGQKPADSDLIADENGNAFAGRSAWGLHAKTYVFSDDSFAVGTFNSDPRSAYLNSEMLIYCGGNRELTDQVVKSISRRIDLSAEIDKSSANVVRDLEHAGPLRDAALAFSLVFSNLFDFLL